MLHIQMCKLECTIVPLRLDQIYDNGLRDLVLLNMLKLRTIVHQENIRFFSGMLKLFFRFQ